MIRRPPRPPLFPCPSLSRPALEGIFLEPPAGTFELRRGFRLGRGQRALLVEDVVTTGLSSREAIAAVAAAGGAGVAPAAPGDPSHGLAHLGVPLFPLLRLHVPGYEPGTVPAALAVLPA